MANVMAFRRAPGSVLAAIVEHIDERRLSRVNIDDFVGVDADGRPLCRNDIYVALRYLDRVCGVLEKTDRNAWRVVDTSRLHDRNRDRSTWHDGGHRRTEKRQPCPTCGVLLGLAQEVCDLCG